jgi:hypothetical protein
MKTKPQHNIALVRTFIVAIVLVLVPLANAVKVGASQISSRSVTISTSASGATAPGVYNTILAYTATANY